MTMSISLIHTQGMTLSLLSYKITEPIQNTKYLYLLQFHVDKLSSAHIYLRMEQGQTWDTLPKELLDDLAQLTKANSIEGT